MIIHWSRGNAPNYVAEHFHLREFECPCGKCSLQQIHSDLLEQLDALHESVPGGIVIKKGYVCRKSVGNATTAIKSALRSGLVAEISSNTVTLEELGKLAENHFSDPTIGKDTVTVTVDGT